MPIDIDSFMEGKETLKPVGVKDGIVKHTYFEYRTKDLLNLLKNSPANEDIKDVLLSRNKENKVIEILGHI